jgi:hypothetical protein
LVQLQCNARRYLNTPSKLCCTSLPIRRLCRLLPARLPVQGPSQKGTQCPVHSRPDGSDEINPPNHAVAVGVSVKPLRSEGSRARHGPKAQKGKRLTVVRRPPCPRNIRSPKPTLAERTSGAVVRHAGLCARPRPRLELSLRLEMVWRGMWECSGCDGGVCILPACVASGRGASRCEL